MIKNLQQYFNTFDSLDIVWKDGFDLEMQEFLNSLYSRRITADTVEELI